MGGFVGGWSPQPAAGTYIQSGDYSQGTVFDVVNRSSDLESALFLGTVEVTTTIDTWLHAINETTWHAYTDLSIPSTHELKTGPRRSFWFANPSTGVQSKTRVLSGIHPDQNPWPGVFGVFCTTAHIAYIGLQDEQSPVQMDSSVSKWTRPNQAPITDFIIQMLTFSNSTARVIDTRQKLATLTQSMIADENHFTSVVADTNDRLEKSIDDVRKGVASLDTVFNEANDNLDAAKAYLDKAEELLSSLEDKSGQRDRKSEDDPTCKSVVFILGSLSCTTCELGRFFGRIVLQVTVALFVVALVFLFHSLNNIALSALDEKQSHSRVVLLQTSVLEIGKNAIPLTGLILVLLATFGMIQTIGIIRTDCF
jgi:hypothetical protein